METTLSSANRLHFEKLVAELRFLEDRLRQGGAVKRIARQHEQGKRTANAGKVVTHRALLHALWGS